MNVTETLEAARDSLRAAMQGILDLSPESLHEWERITRISWHASPADHVPAGFGALESMAVALEWIAL